MAQPKGWCSACKCLQQMFPTTSRPVRRRQHCLSTKDPSVLAPFAFLPLTWMQELWEETDRIAVHLPRRCWAVMKYSS